MATAVHFTRIRSKPVSQWDKLKGWGMREKKKKKGWREKEKTAKKPREKQKKRGTFQEKTFRSFCLGWTPKRQL